MSLYTRRAKAAELSNSARKPTVIVKLASLMSILPVTLFFASCSSVSVPTPSSSHTVSHSNISVSHSNISVQILPVSAEVSSAGSLQLSATVMGTSDTRVVWHATKGSVSRTGLFEAPLVTTATEAIVTAMSQADPLSVDSLASATVTILPAVSTPGLAITSHSLPLGTAGTSYNAALQASGGNQPYKWSTLSGVLPQGLVLDVLNGKISGVPTQPGVYSFQFQVTDSLSHTAQWPSTLTVSATQTSGNLDGPAELPRIYLQTAMANTPARGKTTFVSAGQDFQAVLNDAQCGDTVELQAGATFPGLFTVPAKACDNRHWIIVRTSAPDASLPPEGSRISPCYAGVTSLPGRPRFNCISSQNVLAKILYTQPSGSGPIRFASGANHYRFLGLEIARLAGTGYVGSLVSAQQGADQLIIDRSWLHGSTQDETTTGVALRGLTNAAVINSFLTDFHCTSMVGSCTDAHAVSGGVGSLPGGPYQIVNNFLEASGENILFGGGPATATPTDIEIRSNHFFKPMQWMRGASGFVGGTSGHAFIVKNHLELKNAQRVLVEGNILENSWGGFSQAGFSILLTPKNQAKGTTNNVCPTCRVTDVTIRFNTISHVGAGISIADILSDNGGAALAGERYSIHDVILDDISAGKYNGNGGLFEILNAWPVNVLNSISIEHITAFPDPRAHIISLGNQSSNPPMWGFTFTNNVVLTPKYPVWSTGGGTTNCAYHDVPVLSLTACFTTQTFTRNLLVAASSSASLTQWPSGNYFPAGVADVQFVNFNGGNGGDYHLLPSSSYKNAATDGKDLGADIDAIQAAIANAY